MKVTNLEQKEVDIVDVYVEVSRGSYSGTLQYFVYGVYSKMYFLRNYTALKVTTNADEALDYAEELNHRIVNEIIEESNLTCGV